MRRAFWIIAWILASLTGQPLPSLGQSDASMDGSPPTAATPDAPSVQDAEAPPPLPPVDAEAPPAPEASLPIATTTPDAALAPPFLEAAEGETETLTDAGLATDEGAHEGVREEPQTPSAPEAEATSSPEPIRPRVEAPDRSQLVTPAEAESLPSELADVLPELPRDGPGGVFGLLLLLLVVAFATVMVNRTREGLPRVGLIPRGLAFVSGFMKLSALTIALLIVTRLIPEWMDPIFRWILLAAAAAFGWSARDILPDLLAGVIITLERRVRPGVWVSGDGFSGLVESRGPRAVWIRDTHGHLVSVPNRVLLNRPTFTDTGIGVGHEITLRLQTQTSATLVRQALHDAVLVSPWVPPTVSPLVLRDTADPELWHLRCRLLEPGHALHFEGELLERAEEIIRHLNSSDPDQKT